MRDVVHVDGSEDSTRRSKSNLRSTKRQAITLKSLEKYGAIIVARGMKESAPACQYDRAGACRADRQTATRTGRKEIRNAGAIFPRSLLDAAFG